MNYQKKFSEAHWDKEDSTFRNHFYYSCGKIRTGYSKKIGYNESTDKRRVIAGLLIRTHDWGYFNQPKNVDGYFECLDVFQNISKIGWKRIVTIYPDYIDIDSDIINPEIANFLWHFDRERSKGFDKKFRERYIPSKTKRNDNLKLSPRFMDKFQLKNHCKRLLDQDKEVLNDVREFFRKYCIEFFNGFADEDQEFYDFLLHYKTDSLLKRASSN
jgi:hypothetical protein